MNSPSSSPSPWTPRFAAAVQKLLKTEGGFVNHPNDPGGATNFGISLRFLKAEGRIDLNHDGFADFDLDMDGDIDGADIRKLTPEHARQLYHRCFWTKLGCEKMPQPVGEMMFDLAVNGGFVSTIKTLQRAINFCGTGETPIAVDGIQGPATDRAMWRVIRTPAKGSPALIVAIREMAKARYRALVRANPDLGVFLKGWLARADSLGKAV